MNPVSCHAVSPFLPAASITFLILLVALSCRNPVPVGQGADSGKPHAPPTSGESTSSESQSPAEIAVTVDDEPIYLTEVQVLEEKGQGRVEALQTLIREVLLARQAVGAEFPREKDESRASWVQRFLEVTFSEQTLCSRIGPRELRSVYEATYKKDWPARMFTGEVLEVRCKDLSAAEASTDFGQCMKENRPILKEFGDLRDRWSPSEGRSGLPLKARFPRLQETTFMFLDFVALTPEEQNRGQLFDPETRKVIMTLGLGDVSPPIESSVGYHLVRLKAFRPAITWESPSFQKEARRQICKQRIAQTRADYLERLMSSCVIRDGVVHWPKEGRPRVEIR